MKADKSCSRHETSFYALFPISALRWLALAVVCIGLTAPAMAAKKAPAVAPAPEAAASGKTVTVKPGPGETLAKAMMARGRPSDKGTNLLMPLAGTWEYQEMFWTDPKVEPNRSMGGVTYEMIMSNRYISGKSDGMLDIGGQQEPQEGLELIGYDAAKKTFTFATVDNMTQGMVTGTATFDEKKQVLTEKGRFINPLTGTEQAFRTEIAFIDMEHFTRTVFTAGKSGKETKLIEIDYTRK